MKFLFKQSSAPRFLQRAELCLPLIFLRSSETYVSLEFMQNSESEGKNGLYELGVLIVPSISEDVARSVFSDIMEILSKHGAGKKARKSFLFLKKPPQKRIFERFFPPLPLNNFIIQQGLQLFYPAQLQKAELSGLIFQV